MLAVIPASAHHLVVGQFDTTRTITVQGRVTRVDWSNPHAHFFVQAQGGSWDFELGSPNGLTKRGWTSTSLHAGDVVTASGYASKDGSHLVETQAVNLANGHAVFTGSAKPAVK
jgi:hypothetical protein